jgi:DNA topoisomerase-1
VDDKGRKQYLYHERWREFRDLLNFFRLVSFGERLPRVRQHVERQLRRRTLDRDQILSTMVRIIDTSAIRIGNEVYAEENDSYGLSTLHRRHARVSGARVTFRFPAKSGRQAEIDLTTAAWRQWSAGSRSSAAPDCSPSTGTPSMLPR